MRHRIMACSAFAAVSCSAFAHDASASPGAADTKHLERKKLGGYTDSDTISVTNGFGDGQGSGSGMTRRRFGSIGFGLPSGNRHLASSDARDGMIDKCGHVQPGAMAGISPGPGINALAA